MELIDCRRHISNVSFVAIAFKQSCDVVVLRVVEPQRPVVQDLKRSLKTITNNNLLSVSVGDILC